MRRQDDNETYNAKPIALLELNPHLAAVGVRLYITQEAYKAATHLTASF